MTKTDFISTLDFEVAKKSIARKLGIKSTDLNIKPSKSGDFKINLKNCTGNINSLFSGARKAILVTDNLNITDDNNKFYYKANVLLDIKGNNGEYISKVGLIDSKNNKLVFHTLDDMKTTRKRKTTENVEVV